VLGRGGIGSYPALERLSYNYRMNKRAVSVTLRPDNILWLKTRVKASGGRSLSQALDEIITEARTGASASATDRRSVVGNARIPASEAALSRAAQEIRAQFRRAIGRRNEPSRGTKARSASRKRA
jgi:hypothetical protein